MTANTGLALAVRFAAPFLILATCSVAWTQGVSRDPAFFLAIQRNNTNAAIEMLAANTNLVRLEYNKRLPLHVAASKGRIEIVRELVARGADLDAASDTLETFNQRLTALQAAVCGGHLNVCRLLLEAGADPDLQSPFLGSALLCAIERRRSDIVHCLLDFGADPYRERKHAFDKTTPLEAAITKSDGRLVPRMLGQDQEKPLAGQLPAQAAERKAKGRDAAAARLLAERGPILLLQAAERGEFEAVDALLKAGVPAKASDTRGEPVMRRFSLSAALSAHPDAPSAARWTRIRARLIEGGAEYDEFAATAFGDLERLRYLAAATGGLHRAADAWGRTPLHWAVLANQPRLTAFWLEAGVSPAATNAAGQAALHLAATRGWTAHMELLLAAHAPTTQRDTNGWTPLDAAIDTEQRAAIRLLLQDKSSAPRPERGIATDLHRAAEKGEVGAVAELAEPGAGLEARDELGFTPLHLAVHRGHLASAALLVERGADVNARDPAGNTLLHLVLLRPSAILDLPPAQWLQRMKSDPRSGPYLKHLEIGDAQEEAPDSLLQAAAFLLACGLDANLTNQAGQTAVQMATDEKTSSLLFQPERQAAFLGLVKAGGGNLDAADANGDTALHRACQGTETDRLAGLLASGASINATNHQGRTPLHKAVERMYTWDPGDGAGSPLQFLLKRKPDVNAQDNEGLTPLHVLATADTSFKKEAAGALLAAGADPKRRDHLGRTPIHTFLSGAWPWNDAQECIEMLVRAGAGLDAKDDRGRTPLHCLAAHGRGNPLFFIHGISNIFTAAHVDIEPRDQAGDTPLHVAARSGNAAVLDWLVTLGGSLDATNGTGETPRLLAVRSTNSFSRFSTNPDIDVHTAVVQGKLESLAALLKADPQLLNRPRGLQNTPLRMAVLARRTNVIEFLDRQGARWDAVTAALAGRADQLRRILRENPAAVTNTYDGRSLLHLGVASGSLEVTKAAREAGGELQGTDPWGLSPLGQALIERRTDIADYLRRQGAKRNIFDAAYDREVPAIKELLAGNPSFATATNGHGVAVLEVAAMNGDVQTMGMLLASGASAAAVNPRDGCTALHVAAIYNRTNTAELLLKRGARLDAEDRAGLTPLHLAAAQGSLESAALLLAHQADPNHRTALVDRTQPGPPPGSTYIDRPLAGCTSLHLAARCGQTSLIELLLRSGAQVNATNAAGSTALDLAQTQFEPAPRLVVMGWRLRRMLEPIYFERANEHAEEVRRFAANRQPAAALLEQNGGTRSRRAGPPWR